MHAGSELHAQPAPEVVSDTVLTSRLLADETRVQLSWALLVDEFRRAEHSGPALPAHHDRTGPGSRSAATGLQESAR